MEQKGDKAFIKGLCKRYGRNVMTAQILEVSSLGVEMMLRLERGRMVNVQTIKARNK